MIMYSCEPPLSLRPSQILSNKMGNQSQIKMIHEISDSSQLSLKMSERYWCLVKLAIFGISIYEGCFSGTCNMQGFNIIERLKSTLPSVLLNQVVSIPQPPLEWPFLYSSWFFKLPPIGQEKIFFSLCLPSMTQGRADEVLKP